MTRVVIDTNVFVSSFFGGNPRRIIDLWKTGKIILCLSRLIIEEYVDVLRRLGLQNEKELDELLSLFAQGFHVLFSAQTPKLNVVLEDPDDNKFIECAVALKARVLSVRGQTSHRYQGLYENQDHFSQRVSWPCSQC